MARRFFFQDQFPQSDTLALFQLHDALFDIFGDNRVAISTCIKFPFIRVYNDGINNVVVGKNGRFEQGTDEGRFSIAVVPGFAY